MKILCFDAITDRISVCVNDFGYQKVHPAGPARSSALASMVSEALQELRLKAQDLDGVATGTGPGSFTSIRVSLAFAKGFAFGAGLPLCGFSSLHILANNCRLWSGPIYAVLPLGGGRWGVATFDADGMKCHRRTPDEVAESDSDLPDPPKGALLCGDWPMKLNASSRFMLAPPECNWPRADSVANLAEAYFAGGGEDQRKTLEPNYLQLSTPERQLLGLSKAAP